MAKPNKIPTWATDGSAEITEPSAGKRAVGWLLERPAFQYTNWLFNLIGTWLDFIDSQFASDGVKRVAAVADLAALKALVPADGEVVRVGSAVYVFKAGDATDADDVLVVADTGNAGRWLHVAQPVAGVGYGLARLVATNTDPLRVRLGLSDGPAIEGTAGDDTSGTGVEGYSGTDGGAGVRGVNRRMAGGVGVVGSGSDGETGAGDGVNGIGGGSGGVGVYGEASANNDAGVEGKGHGAGAGVKGTGGAAGSGVDGTGGATSGPGVKGTAQAGNSNGVEGTGHGTGAGVKGTGAVGVEGVVASGSTNGDGVKGTGKGTGVGVRGVGAAGGVGVRGEGVDDGSIGVEGVGGGSSVGTGVKGTGSSAGAGVWGVGGSGGVGGRFEANAQRGAINIAYAGEPSNPELGDMVFDTSPLVNKLKVCTQVSPSIVWTELN